MSQPIVLSTWSFGAKANEAAWPLLAEGKSALDAVVAGCRAVELDPKIDSVGVGGLPDRSGRISLDGCVMESPARCGAVACIRRHAHPAQLARLVMERTQHMMLVGPDADDFADAQGMESRDLHTDQSREKYTDWIARHPNAATDYGFEFRPEANIEEKHTVPDDTVGVLALDQKGQLAGACSTSGRAYKVPGRVGDSPIFGHGLYVDPHAGAAVATGTGELIMGTCGTFLAVEMLRNGSTPHQAAVGVLHRIVESYEMGAEYQIGIIVLAKDGQWSSSALRKGYSTAVRSGDGSKQRDPHTILL